MLHRFRQPVDLADRRKAEVLSFDAFTLLDHVPFEQLEQKRLLGLRPLPVFLREAVQRDLLQPDPRRFLDKHFDRVGTACVTFGSGQAATLGPAAVPVHNERDMSRELIAM